jgi:predicted DNA-binding transcriptional regulator AlpA
MMAQLLWNSRQAAKALAISEKTLWSLTYPRGTIPSIRVGERSVRYSVAALEQWIAQQGTADAESGVEDPVRTNTADLRP